MGIARVHNSTNDSIRQALPDSIGFLGFLGLRATRCTQVVTAALSCRGRSFLFADSFAPFLNFQDENLNRLLLNF